MTKTTVFDLWVLSWSYCHGLRRDLTAEFAGVYRAPVRAARKGESRDIPANGQWPTNLRRGHGAALVWSLGRGAD